MAKTSKVYVCDSCGNEIGRWLGKCPSCGALSSMKEQTRTTGATAPTSAGLKTSGAVTPAKKAFTISELSKAPLSRIPSGIGELDRVLGGGFVAAEVILFAGAPGAGKSTLCLDISRRFAQMGKKVLYSSGEESEHQIGLRAQRMGVTEDNIRITNETHLESLLGHIEAEKPDFLIVDSLQTLASTDVAGGAGGSAQSRECAHVLARLAKREGIIMVLINQVIKSGDFAGPEAVQHIVDCSLFLESDTDTPLKFLRAGKNRFGEVTEVGVFQHSEKGLEEVSDPSGVLLEEGSGTAHAGTACSFMSEGMRQIPLEVQALASSSTLPTPRKQFSGVNFQRGQIVCAILDKFCKTKLFEKDVFISTVSGLKVNDPQSDLAIAAALLSSVREKPFPERTAFLGELSLTGMVRGGFMVEHKVREAERLGFTRVVIPKSALKSLSSRPKNISVEGISTVKELSELLGTSR